MWESQCRGINSCLNLATADYSCLCPLLLALSSVFPHYILTLILLFCSHTLIYWITRSFKVLDNLLFRLQGANCFFGFPPPPLLFCTLGWVVEQKKMLQLCSSHVCKTHHKNWCVLQKFSVSNCFPLSSTIVFHTLCLPGTGLKRDLECFDQKTCHSCAVQAE